jgi:hypothetical protein
MENVHTGSNWLRKYGLQRHPHYASGDMAIRGGFCLLCQKVHDYFIKLVETLNPPHGEKWHDSLEGLAGHAPVGLNDPILGSKDLKKQLDSTLEKV